MKTPSLYESIKHFERQFRKLSIESKVSGSITALDEVEFLEAFSTLKPKGCKIHKPFELGKEQNYSFFEYKVPGTPGITIKVKTPQIN